MVGKVPGRASKTPGRARTAQARKVESGREKWKTRKVEEKSSGIRSGGRLFPCQGRSLGPVGDTLGDTPSSQWELREFRADHLTGCWGILGRLSHFSIPDSSAPKTYFLRLGEEFQFLVWYPGTVANKPVSLTFNL